jgi:hypothetical protein
MANRPNLGILCLAFAAACLYLAGCKATPVDNPTAPLQKSLAFRLGDPSQCPTGGSQDVQKIIDAAGAEGIAQLPGGCYEIKTTITLPTCSSLYGAGADKTLLYRNPTVSYSQPMLRVSGRQMKSCLTQISGLAFMGVRNTDDTGQDYGVLLTNIKDFRIDHSYFEGFGFAAVRVEGDSSGVVDHSMFVDNFKKASITWAMAWWCMARVIGRMTSNRAARRQLLWKTACSSATGMRLPPVQGRIMFFATTRC